MICPKCKKEANTNELKNKYFLGRNSNNIPIFKCCECGNIFYIDETNNSTHSIQRHIQNKGIKVIAFIWGITYLIISIIIIQIHIPHHLHFLKEIGFLLFAWLGISNALTAIKGSEELLSELNTDLIGVPLSKKASNEWTEIHKEAYEKIDSHPKKEL